MSEELTKQKNFINIFINKVKMDSNYIWPNKWSTETLQIFEMLEMSK